MVEDRCLPAYTRRRSVGSGRLVRRASSERSVEMEVLAGIDRGIAGKKSVMHTKGDLFVERLAGSEVRNAGIRDSDLLESPDTFLTKMCIVSSTSEPMELMLEMLSERRIMVAVLLLC